MANEEKRIRNEEKAIRTAFDCFVKFGVHNTTMETVSRQSNLSRMTLIRYFKDRDGMIMSVIRFMCDDIKRIRGYDEIKFDDITAYEQFCKLLDLIVHEFKTSQYPYRFRNEFFSFLYYIDNEKLREYLPNYTDFFGYRTALLNILKMAQADSSIYPLEDDLNNQVAHIINLLCGFMADISFQYKLDDEKEKAMAFSSADWLVRGIKNYYLPK